MQRILDAHVAKAQLAEFGQGLAHIMRGDIHLSAPYMDGDGQVREPEQIITSPALA
jgi:hypothetical protein